MKSIASELAYFLRGRARQNLKVLALYCAFLVVMTLGYASVFRYLMLHLEGREFSFIAGIYWTLTVMTTLGFGDITFHTDPGYIFAAVVTISGVLFLLIILPFGMISLFLAPWIENRLRYKPTLSLPEGTRDHIIIFGMDPVIRSLIPKLVSHQIPFVLVTPDYAEAVRLEEEGFRVVFGRPTDAQVLRAIRADAARYIIANLTDPENVNICLTLRGFSKTPVVTLLDEAEHQELLLLAGASQVIPLKKILGRYLATRTTTQGAMAHVLDSFGKLQIAEFPVHGTPFVNLSLAQACIRQQTGLSVIGIWERGELKAASSETILGENSLVVLAGTSQQLDALEQITGEQACDDLIFILGHGRIGCAAAGFLDRKAVPFILVDRQENPHCKEHIVVEGDATGRNLLKNAGIDAGKGLIVTTNDDSTNIFLTLTGRRTNPHIRIVSRANREENVEQLYAAGADFVVSNASVGANILFNVIESKESIFLTEGINVFRCPLPPKLAGRTIAGSEIRLRSGCSVVAIEPVDGSEVLVSPEPETVLTQGMGLILIGSSRSEETFHQYFS